MRLTVQHPGVYRHIAHALVNLTAKLDSLSGHSNACSDWLGSFTAIGCAQAKSKPTDVHQNQSLDNMPQLLALIKE
jgi:hypothetical protein